MIVLDACAAKNTKMVSGASFCQDDKIVQETHEIEAITVGYQKWHGALPNFRSRDTIKMIGIIDGHTE